MKAWLTALKRKLLEIQNEKRQELTDAVSLEIKRIEEVRAKIDVDKITAKIKQLEGDKQELETYKNGFGRNYRAGNT